MQDKSGGVAAGDRLFDWIAVAVCIALEREFERLSCLVRHTIRDLVQRLLHNTLSLLSEIESLWIFVIEMTNYRLFRHS